MVTITFGLWQVPDQTLPGHARAQRCRASGATLGRAWLPVASRRPSRRARRGCRGRGCGCGSACAHRLQRRRARSSELPDRQVLTSRTCAWPGAVKFPPALAGHNHGTPCSSVGTLNFRTGNCQSGSLRRATAPGPSRFAGEGFSRRHAQGHRGSHQRRCGVPVSGGARCRRGPDHPALCRPPLPRVLQPMCCP